MKTFRFKLFLALCGLSLFLGVKTFYDKKSSQSYPPSKVSLLSIKKELKNYSTADLYTMLSAGEEILKWNETLQKHHTHIVSEVLKKKGTFYEKRHYPLDDTFDWDTYSQYYYHAHRGGEHGHFHLFLRQGGMSKGASPIYYNPHNKTFSDIDTYAHLIAISMNEKGQPLSLFTTNSWVTGEDWYGASDVKQMISRFHVTHSHPSHIVNMWLDAMLILFRPQIERLIEKRDEVIQKHGKAGDFKEVLEKRSLEVISKCEISIDAQIRAIKEYLDESKEDKGPPYLKI